MSDDRTVSGNLSADPNTVAFEYIKSTDFRTVWADGAIGGVTPAGFIHFAVYSERPPIPRRQEFQVTDEGAVGQKLGPEIPERRISRDAFVREMPIDIMVSAGVAESLAQWLMQQVESIRNQGAKVRE
jgi:hypothetical protein